MIVGEDGAQRAIDVLAVDDRIDIPALNGGLRAHPVRTCTAPADWVRRRFQPVAVSVRAEPRAQPGHGVQAASSR